MKNLLKHSLFTLLACLLFAIPGRAQQNCVAITGNIVLPVSIITDAHGAILSETQTYDVSCRTGNGTVTTANPTPNVVAAAAGRAVCEPPSATHFSSRHSSLAACHRSSGSLAMHVFTTRSSCGGVMGVREDIGGGSISKIFTIRLAWLLPSKAFLPVAISYATTPKAKMSVRASTSFPSTCSGAMYCSVPRIVPCAVTALF
jgi:hypothetical protein